MGLLWSRPLTAASASPALPVGTTRSLQASPRVQGEGDARGDEEMTIGLVTDDLDLYLASVTAGRDAINVTHERARRLG